MPSQCKIVQVGKQRNGSPRFWCRAHGANATGVGGTMLDACGRSNNVIQEDEIFHLDMNEYPGGVGVWGAVKPVYNTASQFEDLGIHVHARKSAQSNDKDIDKTFRAISIPHKSDLFKEDSLVITREAAVAYYLSQFRELNVVALQCDRCGEIHLDEDYFAVHPHRKHLCESCGRNFQSDSRSVSNPVALMLCLLSESGARETKRATESLDIDQADYPGGIEIWASNPAILWTRRKTEEKGLHVHTYKKNSQEREDDDTFASVKIDGELLDESQIRYLMAQYTLEHLDGKITSLKCPKCGHPHFDKDNFGFLPHLNHLCESCNHKFDTLGRRRKVISNPSYEILTNLRKSTTN